MLKKKFTLKITVKTGLHIGIGSDKLQIGGVDNPFIKDPVSLRPYIPGSSMKGKLRCLLETESSDFEGELDDKINLYFGATSSYLQAKKKDSNDGATRIIFRDIFLTNEYQELYDKGIFQTEIKTEIKIDRKKGIAEGGALRTTERIPPNTKFEGEILIRAVDENELYEIKAALNEAIGLLNNDYLGGSGSRGYGAVKAELI